MKICQVEKTLVATARIGQLGNRRLLVVKERGGGSKQVAVDPVGCKPGDWVIVVGSSAARTAAGSNDYPSDYTIVGIIDYWEDDGVDKRPAHDKVTGTGTAAPDRSGEKSGKK